MSDHPASFLPKSLLDWIKVFGAILPVAGYLLLLPYCGHISYLPKLDLATSVTLLSFLISSATVFFALLALLLYMPSLYYLLGWQGSPATAQKSDGKPDFDLIKACVLIFAATFLPLFVGIITVHFKWKPYWFPGAWLGIVLVFQILNWRCPALFWPKQQAEEKKLDKHFGLLALSFMTPLVAMFLILIFGKFLEDQPNWVQYTALVGVCVMFSFVNAAFIRMPGVWFRAGFATLILVVASVWTAKYWSAGILNFWGAGSVLHARVVVKKEAAPLLVHCAFFIPQQTDGDVIELQDVQVLFALGSEIVVGPSVDLDAKGNPRAAGPKPTLWTSLRADNVPHLDIPREMVLSWQKISAP